MDFINDIERLMSGNDVQNIFHRSMRYIESIS